jgi:hypothetical protein
VLDLLARVVQRSVPALGHPLFDRYASEINRKIAAGKNFVLLSTPTHTGGWIDPAVLVRRVADHLGEPGPIDAQMALWRLAPVGRDAVVEQAAPLSSRLGWALRYALGDDSIQPRKNDPLWMAAIRSRWPVDDPEGLTRWSDRYRVADGAVSAAYALTATPPGTKEIKGWNGKPQTVKVPAKVAVKVSPRPGTSDLIPAARHRLLKTSPWGWPVESIGELRWGLSVWPSNRFALFAQAVRELSSNLEASPSQYRTETERLYMEWVTTPPHDLGEVGHLLLCMGLNSAFSTTRDGAVDAAIRNIETDQFDCESFGRQLGFLLSCHFGKVNRLHPALQEVCSTSPHHARAIGAALCYGLDLGDSEPPRLFPKLLELLAELKRQHDGLFLATSVRAYVEKLPDQGKTASLRRQLLA